MRPTAGPQPMEAQMAETKPPSRTNLETHSSKGEKNMMKLGPTLRMLLSVLLLAGAVGVVWWVLGFQLGKGVLEGNSDLWFRRLYSFDDTGFIKLLFLSMV